MYAQKFNFLYQESAELEQRVFQIFRAQNPPFLLVGTWPGGFNQQTVDFSEVFMFGLCHYFY
jgi:hypothetical protein